MSSRAHGERLERLQALRRVATIESIGSSTRIEGSKLTDRQVEQLLTKLEIKSFETRDEQEVAGYAEVMEIVFSSWEHTHNTSLAQSWLQLCAVQLDTIWQSAPMPIATR